MKCVICKKCNWVAFEVTRAHAEAEVKSFNEYYRAQPKKVQKMFSGLSSVKSYERCFFCGEPYTNFRNAKKSEIPFGSTLQPVIRRKD